nr:hypothetical protein [Halalkalibacter hemicellulosilyticus]
MEKHVQQFVQDLEFGDKQRRYDAFLQLMEITKEQVDWAYDVWETLIHYLSHKDNHMRAIAAQLLCQLAKSDREKRIVQDFKHVLEVTKDKRFVTARHSLQSLWKIGLVGEEQQSIVMEGLRARYEECIHEKNTTLIRYDIIVSLKKWYDVKSDNKIKDLANTLIELEEDEKYQKKYRKEWRGLL